MNRALAIISTLFILSALSVVFADTPEIEAEQLFAEGKYAEGQSVLLDALEAPGLTSERQASIRAELALVYGDLAGDPGMARNEWIQIRRLPLSPQHSMMVQAAEHLKALRLQKERFVEQEKRLAAAAGPTDDPVLLKQRIADLRSLIKDYPDFPDTARAYHLLGQHLLKTEQYWPAVRAFDRAVRLKPAIGLVLPVDSARSIALLEFKRGFVPKASWTVIGLVFLIALISALREKPHLQSAKSLHMAVIIVLAGWVVLCLVMTGVLLAIDLNREGIPYPKPTMLKKLWYQPGGVRQLVIFVYTLLIGTVTFLVAVATARWRSHMMRNSILLLIVALLSVSMAAGHHMMFLSRDTEYLPDTAIFYSLIYMNEYELPDSKAAILQMLSNASQKERDRLMAYHLKDWDPEQNRDKTIDDLVELLMEKERAEK